MEVTLARLWLLSLLELRVVPFLEEPVENDVIIVLRDEATKIVVLFQETHQLIGRSIVGQLFRHFPLNPQKLLEYFLTSQSLTLPIPLR